MTRHWYIVGEDHRVLREVGSCPIADFAQRRQNCSSNLSADLRVQGVFIGGSLREINAQLLADLLGVTTGHFDVLEDKA